MLLGCLPLMLLKFSVAALVAFYSCGQRFLCTWERKEAVLEACELLPEEQSLMLHAVCFGVIMVLCCWGLSSTYGYSRLQGMNLKACLVSLGPT